MIKNNFFLSKIAISFVTVILFFVLLHREIYPQKKFIFTQDSIYYIPLQLHSKTLSQKWINLNQLPNGVVEYLIEIEDKRFYHHRGISLTDIQNALFHFLFLGKKMRGASTITQQLARTLFLKKSNKLERKWKEMQIALALEKIWDKKTILEYYLNHVYWGLNLYGIQNASTYYFEKNPSELETDEWKTLINILKKPNLYLK